MESHFQASVTDSQLVLDPDFDWVSLILKQVRFDLKPLHCGSLLSEVVV